jgi:PHD/YefM family antitoxin component YafN of YafNO toxin-antitoxin module
MTQLTITQARREFTSLPKRLARTPEHALGVTRDGQPVLAVMSWDLYESIIETLDILADPDQVAALRASIDDIAHGRLVSNEEAKRRLGV